MSTATTGQYGLPLEVKFCARCVISNQRPSSAVEIKHTIDSKKHTIEFDAEGVCSACRVAEEKDKINWNYRKQMLKEICDRYRRKDGKWDCVVPGSGGKDSFFQAHMLKYEFGMNPLTVTWRPHLYTDWGWRNFNRWIDAGLDNILVSPNSRVHRLLTRLAVENLYHPFQPFILGQKYIGPRMAAKFGIPLVFYGENEAEYGNPKADVASALRSSQYHTRQGLVLSDEMLHQFYIGGVSVAELISEYGLSLGDLVEWYLPPAAEEVELTEVHYLGYYLRWHPQEAYYYAVEHGGFEASPERTPGTYSKYNSIDDKVDDLHYYTTFCKFGIGRATYDAAQEIRNGEITREDGVSLVHKYDGEWPARFWPELSEYLSVRKSEFPRAYETLGKIGNMSWIRPQAIEFMELGQRFRPPHLWEFVPVAPNQVEAALMSRATRPHDVYPGWSLKHQVV